MFDYTCEVRNQVLSDVELAIDTAAHSKDRANEEVKILITVNSTIGLIPKQLLKTFPNLKVLNLSESKLQHIKRGDFKGVKKLQQLLLNDNELKAIQKLTIKLSILYPC